MKRQKLLHGHLYKTEGDHVMIVLVRHRARRELCRYLVHHGVSAYAMDIDLPLVEAPVDALKDECQALLKEYRTIGLLCFDTYTIYGLYGASVCPDIHLVIASLPMDRVFESLTLGTSMLSDCGKPVPYQAMGMDAKELHHLHRFYSHRFHHNRYIEVYEFALLKNEPAGIIDCNQINGDLYVFSSADDLYWNSREACRRIKKQLTQRGFNHRFKHILYKRAAQDLLPLKVYNRIAKMTHHADAATQASRADFQQQLEAIIRDWLKA